MKIRTPKQFEAAVKEMLQQLDIYRDESKNAHERRLAKERAEEIDKAITECPYTCDPHQNVVVEYRIHITPSYCFRFQSLLSWWQIFLIKLVGWKIKPVED